MEERTMPYNKNSSLWPNKTDNFFNEKYIIPIEQSGPHCVSTVLAMLSGKNPDDFQNIINTQDPISWSDSLKEYGMKLAYCPFDIRKLKFYMDELIELNDLFILCYYSENCDNILNDPNENGWICGSHVVILHKDKIIDPNGGLIESANEHKCNDRHTKRIFRVVPASLERGL